MVGSVSASEAEWGPAAKVEAGGCGKHDVAAGKVGGLGAQTEGEAALGAQVALVNTRVEGGMEAGTVSGVGLVAEVESKVLAECAELVVSAFDSDCTLLSLAVASASGESSVPGIGPMAVFVVVAETVAEGTVLDREGSQGVPAGALVEAGTRPVAVVGLLDTPEVGLTADPCSPGRLGEEAAPVVNNPESVAPASGPTAAVEIDFGDILPGRSGAGLEIAKMEEEAALENAAALETVL